MRKWFLEFTEVYGPYLTVCGLLIIIGSVALAPSLIGAAFVLFGVVVALAGALGWVRFNDKYR